MTNIKKKCVNFAMKARDIVEYIKLCCVKRNTSPRQASIKAGISAQSYFIKKKNNSFYLRDIEKLADAMDAEFEIKFIDRETGLPII